LLFAITINCKISTLPTERERSLDLLPRKHGSTMQYANCDLT